MTELEREERRWVKNQIIAKIQTIHDLEEKLEKHREELNGQLGELQLCTLQRKGKRSKIKR